MELPDFDELQLPDISLPDFDELQLPDISLFSFSPPCFSPPQFESEHTEWTYEDNKLFENALAEFDPNYPFFLENVASKVPCKSIEQIKKHYEALVEDIKMIESGHVPIPNYHETTKEPQGDLEVKNEKGSSSKGKRPDYRHHWRKGVPWTEEEHKLFLMGLKKYGKGHWRCISRHYVVTKNPSQIASHAQKFFKRKNSSTQADRCHTSINDIPSFNSTSVSLPPEPLIPISHPELIGANPPNTGQLTGANPPNPKPPIPIFHPFGETGAKPPNPEPLIPISHNAKPPNPEPLIPISHPFGELTDANPPNPEPLISISHPFGEVTGAICHNTSVSLPQKRTKLSNPEIPILVSLPHKHKIPSTSPSLPQKHTNPETLIPISHHFGIHHMYSHNQNYINGELSGASNNYIQSFNSTSVSLPQKHTYLPNPEAPIPISHPFDLHHMYHNNQNYTSVSLPQQHTKPSNHNQNYINGELTGAINDIQSFNSTSVLLSQKHTNPNPEPPIPKSHLFDIYHMYKHNQNNNGELTSPGCSILPVINSMNNQPSCANLLFWQKINETLNSENEGHVKYN